MRHFFFSEHERSPSLIRSSLRSKCFSVLTQICQSKATVTGQFKVATGNEQIRTDPDDKVYLFYTGDGERYLSFFQHSLTLYIPIENVCMANARQSN